MARCRFELGPVSSKKWRTEQPQRLPRVDGVGEVRPLAREGANEVPKLRRHGEDDSVVVSACAASIPPPPHRFPRRRPLLAPRAPLREGGVAKRPSWSRYWTMLCGGIVTDTCTPQKKCSWCNKTLSQGRNPTIVFFSRPDIHGHILCMVEYRDQLGRFAATSTARRRLGNRRGGGGMDSMPSPSRSRIATTRHGGWQQQMRGWWRATADGQYYLHPARTRPPDVVELTDLTERRAHVIDNTWRPGPWWQQSPRQRSPISPSGWDGQWREARGQATATPVSVAYYNTAIRNAQTEAARRARERVDALEAAHRSRERAWPLAWPRWLHGGNSSESEVVCSSSSNISPWSSEDGQSPLLYPGRAFGPMTLAEAEAAHGRFGGKRKRIHKAPRAPRMEWKPRLKSGSKTPTVKGARHHPVRRP